MRDTLLLYDYYLLDGPLAAVILDEEEVGQKQVRRAHGEERGEAEGYQC